MQEKKRKSCNTKRSLWVIKRNILKHKWFEEPCSLSDFLLVLKDLWFLPTEIWMVSQWNTQTSENCLCLHLSCELIALLEMYFTPVNSRHKVRDSDNGCMINWCPIHSRRPCSGFGRREEGQKYAEKMFYHLLVGAPKSLVKGSARLMMFYIQSHLLENSEEGKKNQIKKKKTLNIRDTNIPNLSKQRCSQAAALKPLNELSHSLAERVGVGWVWGWGYCYISLDTFLLCGLFLF